SRASNRTIASADCIGDHCAAPASLARASPLPRTRAPQMTLSRVSRWTRLESLRLAQRVIVALAIARLSESDVANDRAGGSGETMLASIVSKEVVMESISLLDCAGRRRSPATLASLHQ